MKDTMNPYYKRLGARLKAARKAKGWTQQDLADKTGLTPAFLSYLENGTRSGSLESLLKLAEALNVEPEQLLAGKVAAPGNYAGYPSLSLEGLSVGEGDLVRQMARSLRRKKS
jgi:transcriptional regulator with XRE-family HTH domain